MPYIVKSSLDIGGKVIPWNEQETKKLIKEKTEFLEKKEEMQTAPVTEQVTEPVSEQVEPEESQEKKEMVSKFLKNNKKNQKAGEK